MKYLSLFSGIGGFELGIQRAYSGLARKQECDSSPQGRQETLDSERVSDTQTNGDLYNDTDSSQAACVGYSEIDKYAIKVYERQFNGHKNYGDATLINERELPDFDLLVGGFPCQAFSVAGKRLGFNDTRGTLFFEIARILKHKRPRHLVLENVKGLLSHDSGKTFQTILGVLSDLGYLIEWQVLNSKDFGVPQNWERVFIVGHLGDECRPKVFPITRQSQNDIGDISEKKSRRTIAYTLDANYYKGVSPKGYQGGKRQLINVIGELNRKEKRQNGRRMKTDGEPSFTLNTQDKHGIYDGAKIRRLTPLECERLQGFPQDWTRYDQDGNEISDTQRYKMAGNAVTVNVVEAVMTQLLQPTKLNN